MARRAFLHVGTASPARPYLQDLWWQHRDVLGEQGLLLPGEGRRDHFTAAAVVKGMTAIVETLDSRERNVWERLVDEAREWRGDVLITNEHFSDSPEAAEAALADLAAAADEVHLVVTVRDLGRILPSAWQQRVKMGARQPYRRFLATVRRGEDDQKFWRYQDVLKILDLWSAGIPADRVHLVVLPPSGAPRDELWLRTAAVLGVDVTGLDTAARRPNDSLGIVEAELLRRINEALPRADRSPELTRHVKGRFVPELLVGAAEREPFVVPARHHGWILHRSEALVADLRSRSYDVVGDLGDLLPPEPRQGRTPDEVSDDELLSAATVVLDRIGRDAPETLDEAVALIVADLRAQTSSRAVSEEGSGSVEPPSRTALGHVVRGLAGGR